MQAIDGGSDPGAVNGNRKEKDDALRLAIAVQPLLVSAGHTVVMSRTGDTYTPVSTVAANANASKADYFIALHRNSHKTSSATGIEVLICSKASSTSRKLAEAILKRVVAVGGVNRGVKVQDHRTTVLQKTNMPACTVELGFISNPADNALFDSRFDDYASAIAEGICDVAGRNTPAESFTKSTEDGWRMENGRWYYYLEDKKLSGWQWLEWSGGNDWFYFDDNGAMLTGWQLLEWNGNSWYYFDPVTGAMYASKWAKDSQGKDYYLTASGAMAVSSYVLSEDGRQVYWVGSDGAWDGKSYPVAA